VGSSSYCFFLTQEQSLRHFCMYDFFVGSTLCISCSMLCPFYAFDGSSSSYLCRFFVLLSRAPKLLRPEGVFRRENQKIPAFKEHPSHDVVSVSLSLVAFATRPGQYYTVVDVCAVWSAGVSITPGSYTALWESSRRLGSWKARNTLILSWGLLPADERPSSSSCKHSEIFILKNHTSS